jgi:L-amino acid N-acyltransferase YncA/ADP-ribose pyrophosphatase YjhB (NUDIX family)
MVREIRYQAAIIHDRQILLIQHREHATGRSYWLLPGDGREAGETPEACLTREVQEQTGLTITVERLLLDDPAPVGDVYQRLQTYFCRTSTLIASPGMEPEPEASALYAITRSAGISSTTRKDGIRRLQETRSPHRCCVGSVQPWAEQEPDLKIRHAQPDDLPAIVDIYNQSIPSRQATGHTEPVRVEDRIAWLEEHRPEKYPIFVAELDGQVAGWCSLSAYRAGRTAFRFTAEISYYIALAYRRRGLGKALIEHALAACTALQIRHLFAIVLECNAASLRLLEKMGFEEWGYLPRVADFDGNEVGHLYYGQHV